MLFLLLWSLESTAGVSTAAFFLIMGEKIDDEAVRISETSGLPEELIDRR